jgi:anti-sigma regulatory factor (Ser/Thr protein kinase)
MRREAQFPAVRTSALQARRFVSEAIADVPEEVSDAVTLIASELASNSVRHAASAFAVRVERLPDRIRIEVEDDGGGEPNVKTPGPTDTSGRGLQIVSSLADEWGVIPKREAPGKIVWATVDLRGLEGERLKTQRSRANKPASGRAAGSGGSSESCSDAPALETGAQVWDGGLLTRQVRSRCSGHRSNTGAVPRSCSTREAF